MALSPLLAASVAIVPGIHAWWTGRTLIARTADPAFPELLLARSQRLIAVGATAGAIIIVLAAAHWHWTMPLLLLGILTGTFGFRRALYGETWGLADYLRYTILGVIGGAGFWVLLGFGPRIVVSLATGWTPDHAVAGAAGFAAVLAGILFTWERHFPRVWLALHRATPLQRPDLQSRLDDIVQRAGVRPPTVFRYGARGAYVMNAVALPSAREPGVAFGDTLLELLDGDEIAAVFAHEIAHLEQFDAPLLRRLRFITWALLFGMMMVPVALMGLLPAYAGLAALLWNLLVFGVLFHRLSRSQANEAASDRRSAALMGDPEPMVRALTKLHHYSKLPRRWPYDFERSATHPSLARRIQSLRAESSTVVSGPFEPTVLRSTQAGVYIVLDATRLYWFDGVTEAAGSGDASGPAGKDGDAGRPTLASLRERAASYHATTYADLAELRVGVAGFGRSIQTRDRAGRTSSIALHPEDVAAAQRALDLLDGQLATGVRRNWSSGARKVAALSAIVLIASMNFGWMWIMLLAVLAAPRAWSLAAMGTLMVSGAAMVALVGAGPVAPFWWVGGTLAMVTGAVACVMAWRWAASADSLRRRRLSEVCLASVAALLVAGAQAHGGRAIGLEWTSPPGVTEIIGRLSAEGSGYRVLLSPEGTHVAIQTVDPSMRSNRYDGEDGYDGVFWRFTIGEVGDTSVAAPRIISAFDVAFLDDRRVLALRASESSADSLMLSAESVASDSAAAWRRALPPLAAPTLSVDRRTGRWTVFGYDRDAGDVVFVSGFVGADSVPLARDSLTSLGGRPLFFSPDGAVVYATLNASGGMGRMVLAGLGVLPYRWEIWRSAHGARARLGTVPGKPECAADNDGALLCVVTGPKGVSLWRIDEQRTLLSLGVLPREFDVWRAGMNNHLLGGVPHGGSVAVIDVGAGRGVRLALADSSPTINGFMIDGASGPGVVATLMTENNRSEVTLYRVR